MRDNQERGAPSNEPRVRARAGAARTDALDEEPGFADAILRSKVERDVEHVMTLLALVSSESPCAWPITRCTPTSPRSAAPRSNTWKTVLPERVKQQTLALLAGTVEAPREQKLQRDARALRAELEKSRELVMPAALRNPQRG